MTAVDGHGSAGEVACHPRGTPGSPVLDDAHYPPRDDKDADRIPRATSAEEAAFLQLEPGPRPGWSKPQPPVPAG